MPSGSRQEDNHTSAGPPPAEFVLGAAERALARKSPELAAALREVGEPTTAVLDARPLPRDGRARAGDRLHRRRRPVGGAGTTSARRSRTCSATRPGSGPPIPSCGPSGSTPTTAARSSPREGEALAGLAQRRRGRVPDDRPRRARGVDPRRRPARRGRGRAGALARGDVGHHRPQAAEAEADRRAAQQAAVARLGERALEGADAGGADGRRVSAATTISGWTWAACSSCARAATSCCCAPAYGMPAEMVGTATVPAHRGPSPAPRCSRARRSSSRTGSIEARFGKSEILRQMGGRSGLTVDDRGTGADRSACSGVQSRERPVLRRRRRRLRAGAGQRPGRRDPPQRPPRTRSATRRCTTRSPGCPTACCSLDRLGHALSRLPAQRRSWPCCSSTSTTSSSSTTASATRPATSCWSAVGAPAAPDRAARRHRRALRRRRVRGSCSRTSAPSATPRDVAERIAAAFARPFVLGGSEHFVTASVGIAIAGGGRRRARGADPRRRRRDVPRQGARPRRATSCSTRSCAPAPSGACAWRTSCAARWSATSCACTTSRWSRCATARSSGFEALLRWQHPERGLVAPARVHPGRRGERPDRPDRPLGAARGLPPGRRAGRRCAPTAAPLGHLRQPLGAPGGPAATCRDVVAGVCATRAWTRPASSLEITESVLLEESDAPADALRALRAHSACGSCSTTSAPATRRWATSSASRSTRSRSTARSSTAWAPSDERDRDRRARSSAMAQALGLERRRRGRGDRAPARRAAAPRLRRRPGLLVRAPDAARPGARPDRRAAALGGPHAHRGISSAAT